MASWESLHKRAERIVASRKMIEEQKLQFIDAELYTMNEIYASVIGDKDCQDFRSFLLACDESQRAVLHMDDGTLIIMDEWIRLPTLFMSRIMDRESPVLATSLIRSLESTDERSSQDSLAHSHDHRPEPGSSHTHLSCGLRNRRKG